MDVGAVDAAPDASIGDAAAPDARRLVEIEEVPGGNPLVPQSPALQYPSDRYLVEDADTATGFRVRLPVEALPGNTPAVFDDADGFSLIPLVVAALPGGVAPSSLPDATDPAATLSADASVLLLAGLEGERWPVLAEVDLRARRPGRQALLIRPHIALRPDTDYVAVLRTSLTTLDGEPHEAGPAFAALRDGVATTAPSLESQRPRFETVVRPALEAAGISMDSVVLAWSFHTRSRVELLAPHLALQDAAAELVLPELEIAGERVDEEHGQRIVEGTLTLPEWVSPEGRIELEADGRPRVFGERVLPVVMTLPADLNEPRPVVVFGHGFFSSRYEITWSSFRRLQQRLQLPAIAVDFAGFNEDEMNATAVQLVTNAGFLDRLTARQTQSYADFTVLARLVREQLAVGAFADRLDPDRVSYLGISNGATFGAVILTVSRVFERGALVVGGGGLVHFLQRAVSWNDLGLLVEARYPDDLELQLALSVFQQKLDRIDAASFAAHLVHDRLPGRPELRLSDHMAVHDSQVSNLVTEMVARSAGLRLVAPSAKPVWGLETVEAPPDGDAEALGTLTVYDEALEPAPVGNQPPEEDNGAHETIRHLESYFEHMRVFLEEGRVIQVCDGPCDPD